MKLWGQDFNLRVKKIQVAANHAGHDLVITEIDEAKRKEYLKKAPTGFVPTLETPEGPLYESNAILRYLGRNSKSAKLYGTSVFEEALIDQWLDWCLTELEPALLAYGGVYLGFVPYIKEVHSKVTGDLKTALAVLDGQLKGKTYLVGNQLSIADLGLASALNFAFQFLFDEKYRSGIANVTKWYQGVTNNDQWRKVYGRSHLAKASLPLYTGPLDENAPEPAEEKPAKEPKEKGKKK